MLRGETSFGRVMADGATRRAAQKAAHVGTDLGPQAIGRSRGGLTTKTVAPAAATGKLVDFATPRPSARAEAVRALIGGVPFEVFIAEKSCDPDRVVGNSSS